MQDREYRSCNFKNITNNKIHMKKRLLLFTALFLVLLCFTEKASAQAADTTLLFSRIILYDLGTSSPTNAQSITVPAGKAWKIESVSMGSSGTAPAVFLRNNSTQNIAYFSSPASAASANFPFWLPDGFSGSFFNNSGSFRCTISITEYTKAP
jgi:hypothetical protein